VALGLAAYDGAVYGVPHLANMPVAWNLEATLAHDLALCSEHSTPRGCQTFIAGHEPDLRVMEMARKVFPNPRERADWLVADNRGWCGKYRSEPPAERAKVKAAMLSDEGRVPRMAGPAGKSRGRFAETTSAAARSGRAGQPLRQAH
jgi:hypothetical protein